MRQVGNDKIQSFIGLFAEWVGTDGGIKIGWLNAKVVLVSWA